eukprot:5010838-Pyramimonas_sp.AAC.1
MASRSGFAGSGAGSETESGSLPVLPSAFSTLLRITSLRLCIPCGTSSSNDLWSCVRVTCDDLDAGGKGTIIPSNRSPSSVWRNACSMNSGSSGIPGSSSVAIGCSCAECSCARGSGSSRPRMTAVARLELHPSQRHRHGA